MILCAFRKGVFGTEGVRVRPVVGIAIYRRRAYLNKKAFSSEHVSEDRVAKALSADTANSKSWSKRLLNREGLIALAQKTGALSQSRGKPETSTKNLSNLGSSCRIFAMAYRLL
jgi:hypothetical protein